MKKHNLLYAIMALLAVMATGCEVDIKDGGVDDINELTVNALVTPDTTLIVTVTAAKSYKDFTIDEYVDFHDYEKSKYDDITRLTAVSTARVTATVNGSDVYNLTYDAKHYNYRCDYQPKEGDEVKIQASADGHPAVEAHTTVPRHQALEVVACEKLYDPVSYETDNVTAQDTIARITLRITDPASTTDFYRLKVRSAGRIEEVYYFKDTFSSDDALFKNVSLHKGYQGWAAGMSNVFNDNLINGKTYEFTVESRLRETRQVTEDGQVGPENKWIVVELQSISAEYYNYLNSVWLYRITDRDAYSEAVQIYSNVTDGYGIVGALATEKHIIRF